VRASSAAPASIVIRIRWSSPGIVDSCFKSGGS
jgi:hypothetical protein